MKKSWWNKRSKKLAATLIAVAIPLVNRRFNLGLTTGEEALAIGAILTWVGSRALIEALGGREKHDA